jgi:hypothetical protein
MPFGDDLRDKLSGLAALGAVGVGFGLGIKQAWPEIKPVFKGISTIPKVGGLGLPPYSVSRGVVDSAKYLNEFQLASEAGIAVMGSGGWKEAVGRAVHASLLGSGKVPRKEIAEILERVRGADPSQLVSTVKEIEREVGGLETVYENLRGLMGGRMAGQGGKSVSNLINELGSQWDIASFSQKGGYWSERLGLGALETAVETGQLRSLGAYNFPSGRHSFTGYAKGLSESLERLGVKATVTAGVRELSGEKAFKPGRGYHFKRMTGAGEELILPYAELQIRLGKQVAYVPILHAEGGLVPYGMGRMSTAAVSNFTVQGPGGKRQLVNHNDMLSMAIYGEEGKVGNNLATMIYNGQQEKKALRETTEQFNQIMRSQIREITTIPHARAGKWMSTGIVSTAGSRVIAGIHQRTHVGLEELYERGLGKSLSTQEITRYMQETEHLGAYPLMSPGATAKSGRMAAIPFHERWDIFGRDFPYERRFLQAVREFEPTEAAVKAMGASKIMGRLSRDIPLTATQEYVKEVVNVGYKSPNVVMAYAKDLAQSIRGEEVLVSKSMAEMMETQTLKTYTLHTPFGGAQVGNVVEAGQPLGIDVKSGRMLYGQSTPGQMIEQVVGAETAGDITRLTLARKFPLQEQAKIFGIKATLRTPRDLQRLAMQEYGLSPKDFVSAAGKGLPVEGVEAFGHVGLLKKNPAMIRRQMTEALLMLGARRMTELERAGEALGLDAAIPGTMKRVFGKGGRRYLREALGGATESFEAERYILSLAKSWKLTPAEMGMIGGHFFEQAKSLSSEAEIIDMLSRSGLAGADIKGIQDWKFVIGAPAFHFGDYPLHTAWERGTIEPRGMKELLFQNWTSESGKPLGRAMVEEMERRRIPGQVLGEVETSLMSMVSDEVPKGAARLSAAEAEARLIAGKGGFMMDLPTRIESFTGKGVYVPDQAKLMGWFVPEIGKEMPQPLLADYLRLSQAAQRFSAGEAGAEESLMAAGKKLRETTHKQWLIASQSRGQITGTAAPVAQSWIGKARHFETIEEFARAGHAGAAGFRIGLGKQTARGMFQEMLQRAPEAEKAAIRTEMKRVMGGGVGYGFAFRHPLIYPYSNIPAEMQVLPDVKTGVFFPTVTVGPEKVDLSGAQGMALDTDFDRAVVGFVTNEKSKAAVKETLQGTRFKREYAQAMTLQAKLEDISKKHMGSVPSEYTKIEGLKRHVGVEIATPDVSIAAQRLKFAAQSAGAEDRMVLSTFLAQLEQRPISSKKGGEAEALATSLKRAVTGWVKGEADLPQTKEEFKRAWTGVWGKESFVAEGKRFDLEDYYSRLSGMVSQTVDSGEMDAYNVVRQASRVNRGAQVSVESADEIRKAVQSHRAGLGDPMSQVVRRMQVGPPSGAQMARNQMAQATSKMKALGGTALKYWKYPAVGIGVAAAARYLMAPSSLDMPDSQHDQRATDLAMGAPSPEINTPRPIANRVITNQGGFSPTGYNVNISGDYNFNQSRGLAEFAMDTIGGNLRISDNRGAITPEYIRKIQDER